MYLQGLFVLPINVSYPPFCTLDFILTLVCFYVHFELCVFVSTFQMAYLTYKHNAKLSCFVCPFP